jgi:histidine ammonia-lyase
MAYELNGSNLTIDDVALIARSEAGQCPSIQVERNAREALLEVRKFMDVHWMNDEAPLIYALNTGTGPFKDQRLSMQDIGLAQRKGILAFCAGIGEPFSEEETRALMLIRANAIVAPASGCRPELIDRLLAFLNHRLHPIIPGKGSVGTSGDLAPLAHMSAALIGIEEAEVIYQGTRQPARDALRSAGLPMDIELFAKDTSSLMNGATVSVALLALNIFDARRLAKLADVALALSMEAMRGELAAFDPRMHRVRPHEDQAKVARNVLRLLADSRRCTEAARQVIFPGEQRRQGAPASPRIQDVYSLRCAPQVHGPARTAIEYAAGITETEINSATGNPLIFPDEAAGYVAIAGGHFHGQYVAQAADVLGIAMADLGSICERRVVRLIDPGMSYGLPRNLATGKPGLDTGYPAVQTAVSALVMENRHLSAPASVDSIPGKGNFEDHVSNATYCARKSTTIVRNLEYIVAVEILLATQALTLVEGLASDYPIGAGTAAAMAAVRKTLPPSLEGDRFFARDIEKAVDLVRSDLLLESVEAAIGKLE